MALKVRCNYIYMYHVTCNLINVIAIVSQHACICMQQYKALITLKNLITWNIAKATYVCLLTAVIYGRHKLVRSVLIKQYEMVLMLIMYYLLYITMKSNKFYTAQVTYRNCRGKCPTVFEM